MNKRREEVLELVSEARLTLDRAWDKAKIASGEDFKLESLMYDTVFEAEGFLWDAINKLEKLIGTGAYERADEEQ